MTPRDWDLWNSHSWSSPGLFLLTMWYPSPILACGDFRHTFTIMLISRHTWFWHGRSLELSSTICQLAPSKVPGPEGFTGEFYQTLHKFVEPNLLSVYNDIWQGGLYLPSGNQAIKILLSKKKERPSWTGFIQAHFTFKLGCQDTLKNCRHQTHHYHPHLDTSITQWV